MENALAMRRDPFLMRLLRERQYGVEQTPWHIAPEDEQDATQIQEAALLTKIVKSIPRFKKILRAITECIWYGRAASQVTYDWVQESFGVVFRPIRHEPVNGDKIQFGWDDVPIILVYPAAKQELAFQGAEVVSTERFPGVRLGSKYWRTRFIIAEHDCVDPDFYDANQAGELHGVGIRHWLYWYDWLRKEISSWVFDFMERTGLGLTIYYYEQGNEAARQQAQNAALNDTRNTVIVWPRSTQGENVGAGIERIETQVHGAHFLRDLLEYFDGHIEKFVVGQQMSSSNQRSGALGGSAVAEFQQDTKRAIIADDCGNAADALTEDLLCPLQYFNCPGSRARYRWVFDLEKPDPREKLDAAKACFDMRIPLKVDEVRSHAGYSKPGPEDEVVAGSPIMGPDGMPLDEDGEMTGEGFDEEEGEEEVSGKKSPFKERGGGSKPEPFWRTEPY
jgi:phage gp29-like protein